MPYLYPMASKSRLSLFPATQQDVSRLRQSATDAVNDFGSTAATHATKVGGQLQDLAEHARDESRQRLNQVRARVSDMVNTAVDFASDRPLVCIAAALAVGFLIGRSRRRRVQE
jgi:ElaB/YqjD/DUF883 family membrane-anchored ribosome-binding protein